jgi:Nitroreductase family
MPHIELRSPIPWPTRRPQVPYAYRVDGRAYLPIPTKLETDPGFFATLGARTTRREFALIEDQSLWTWLWNSVGLSSGTTRHCTERWQHRRYPSSGGIHEIDVLIIDRAACKLFLYDPIAHAIGQIVPEDEVALSSLIRDAEAVLPLHDGRLLWLVADVDLVAAKYEYPESLVWRDAGAVVTTMCFVAEAMSLACCPLGITGEPYISRLLGASGRVIGVGGLIIGSHSGYSSRGLRIG